VPELEAFGFGSGGIVQNRLMCEGRVADERIGRWKPPGRCCERSEADFAASFWRLDAGRILPTNVNTKIMLFPPKMFNRSTLPALRSNRLLQAGVLVHRVSQLLSVLSFATNCTNVFVSDCGLTFLKLLEGKRIFNFSFQCGAGILFGKLWLVCRLVGLANVYDWEALALFNSFYRFITANISHFYSQWFFIACNFPIPKFF